MREKVGRTARLRRRVPVLFGMQAPTSSGFTVNVSGRGLGITSTALQRPGTPLLLEARLPDGTASSLRGRVRWSRPGSAVLRIPNLMGVALSAADQPWRQWIESLGADGGWAEATQAPKVLVPDVPRQHRMPRASVCLQAQWGLDRNARRPARTLDISASGLLLSAPEPPTQGTPIQLALTLPDATQVWVQGTVVRARRFSVGKSEPNAFAVRLTGAEEAWYRFVMKLLG